ARAVLTSKQAHWDISSFTLLPSGKSRLTMKEPLFALRSCKAISAALAERSQKQVG
ncbi:MAG: hypothetical protein HC935_05800, partial [Pseudanabaena sp. SU_2_4]|nr:hypothetical protein [Pseudanabaena sp. SU_2_4]